MSDKVYKVNLYRLVKEESSIFVEANSVDDAAITAIEAMSWLYPDWKKQGDIKTLPPMVVGPVVSYDKNNVYKGKK